MNRLPNRRCIDGSLRITANGKVPPTSPPTREIATRDSTDYQAELLPRVRLERLRREAEAIPDAVRLELYAGCDRAPFGWELRHG